MLNQCGRDRLTCFVEFRPMYRKSMLIAAIFTATLASQSVFTADPPPAKADRDNWKSLFDGKSLDGWKAADFDRPGKVHVQDGAIVMDKGETMTGVALKGPKFPKMDYEATLEGKRIDGDDFFCTTTFPVGETYCSLVVGGWGGTIVGISMVNHESASMNETTTIKEFERNRWYRFRIRVTKDRIKAWIDEENLVDLDTTDKRIALRRECDACKPFGFATWKTKGAVRNIRVRELKEAEKKP